MTEVSTSMRYVIKTAVKGLEMKKTPLRTFNTGKRDAENKPVFETEYQNEGWFILLEDSREWRFIDNDKPDLKIGQRVRVIIVGD